MLRPRALHYVLKVGNLKNSVEFFRDKLCMKVLRHEEFDQGCDAACNGPYNNRWTKSMIGYGPEDQYFVLELTYNYNVGSYSLGNDLQYIKISLEKEILDKVMAANAVVQTRTQDELTLTSPDGYKFIVNLSGAPKSDVKEVCLSCSNLDKSLKFWCEILNMKRKIEELSSSEALLNNDTFQVDLRLKQIEETIDHKSAYGRIAFSVPASDLKLYQAAAEAANHKVLTPYISLETPGKATVQVVILADPDGHEICLVGDEGFRELSKVDCLANDLIDKTIAEDKSTEWYEKKGQSKADA